MMEEPEPDGELETIDLVNETTGDSETYLVHDVAEIEGQTYYVLQAENDADRVVILRREGESLVTLDEDEHERVIAQLEEYEEEDGDEDDDDH